MEKEVLSVQAPAVAVEQKKVIELTPEGKVRFVKAKGRETLFNKYDKLGVDGKEWGWVMVEQVTEQTTLSGYSIIRRRTMALKFPVESYNPKRVFEGGYKKGQIIRVDSLEEKPGYQPLMAPHKETKQLVPVTSEGLQVYRINLFDESMTMNDSLLSYDEQ